MCVFFFSCWSIGGGFFFLIYIYIYFFVYTGPRWVFKICGNSFQENMYFLFYLSHVASLRSLAGLSGRGVYADIDVLNLESSSLGLVCFLFLRDVIHTCGTC